MALSNPPAAAAAGCRVDYTVTSQWQGGFQGGVKITNLGDPVSGWTLRFAMPDAGQKVVQGWNATWAQSGSTVTATNVDWNRALGTGASTDLGFVGSFTDANPKPTAITLNGVACTGNVEEPPPGGGGPRPARAPEPRWTSTVSSASAASTCATSTTAPSNCGA
ncbi:hypothetical protein GCM10010393_42020 [Streptomyces gobitricini]|uniref:CBM2 domain-containing protein n=1 Tax=Streptomyces gobitricini TaxID=68211 RepID=A0ABP5ZZ74_9ACTN